MERVPLLALEREWDQLLGSARLAGHFDGWRGAQSSLRSFDSPAAILRYLRGSGDPSQKDRVLEAILHEAASDPLAARFALQAVLPGLKNRARRLLVDARDREDVWSAVIAIAWERIRNYPADDGPRRVAATLVMNIVRDATLELRRRRTGDEALIADAPAGTSALIADSDVDVLMSAAVAAGALSESEAELVLATRIDGRALTEVAVEAGVAYNTMKVRRQRAERRLLLWLGYSPVPRGQQRRPSLAARVVGAGPSDQAGGNDQSILEGR